MNLIEAPKMFRDFFNLLPQRQRKDQSGPQVDCVSATVNVCQSGHGVRLAFDRKCAATCPINCKSAKNISNLFPIDQQQVIFIGGTHQLRS